MKRTIALLLAFALLAAMLLTGCGSSDLDDGISKVDAYMLDDNTVVAKFINDSKDTITHAEGTLLLYAGSSTNQDPVARASFTWDGSCESGRTFTVTAHVSSPPAGLAGMVNRIGFSTSNVR